MKEFISGIAWAVFLWAIQMTGEQYRANVSVAVLDNYPCSCEPAGGGTMAQNMDCPEHGAIRQRLDNKVFL